MSAAMELHVALSLRLDATEAYRLAHAYRDEVLAADGQAYDGELPMLRGLVETLRTVLHDGRSAEGQRAEARLLIWRHDTDAETARAEEKATPTGATATPAGPTGRVAQLLDAIRAARGRWTTVTAYRFYRDHISGLNHLPNTQLRAVARGDLRDLAAWGHLLRHEEPGRQYYTLKTGKDTA